MSEGGYRAALRIARRDALRAKGRTALVLCMIGLPIMAIVALSVLTRTGEWSPEEALPYEIGAADARLTGVGREPLNQGAGGERRAAGGRASDDRPWTTPEVSGLVTGRYGPRARAVPMTADMRGTVRTGRGYVPVRFTELDLRDPLTCGMFRIVEGRAPATPDEVALAPSLRDRGFAIGTVAQVDREGTRRRVVGFAEDPRRLDTAIAVGLPGAFPGVQVRTAPQWLISAGRDVTWDDAVAFNKAGIEVLSHAVVADPPPAGVPAGEPEGVGSSEAPVVALGVAMIMLEVVLLSGPAFAVGIRRRRRQLALVAAVGGDERHLRAVVLAGGLVIGAAAAVLGAGLGIGAAAAAKVFLGLSRGAALGPFEVPWTPVALTMALGAGSGVVAAYLPAAQAARLDVVAALAGRREAARTRRGWPLAGAALIAAGIVMSLLGVRILREFGAALGAVAIIVGCVLAVPWTVGAAGRVARFLPLPLRLAVRDGSRNRGRAAPVVAAIMAAVAGITVLAIGGASDFRQERGEYDPQLPLGSAIVRPPLDRVDDVTKAVGQELPGVPLVTLRSLPGENGVCQSERTEECPAVTFAPDGVPAVDDGVYGMTDLTLDNVVGGAREVRLLLGRDDPAVTAALAAGKVVLPGAEPLKNGTVTGEVSVWTQDDRKTLKKVPGLQAVALPGDAHVGALVPPAVAERIGVPLRTEAFGIDRADHRVTTAEQARLEEVLLGFMEDERAVHVERGFTGSFGRMTLLLGVIGAVLALGGALIATGLSAADARPDLATLAAIGARPRTRRVLMMGQAGFIATLGCWLGLAAGLIPGIAVAGPLTTVEGEGGVGAPEAHGPILDIPWTLLGVIAVVIPLVTMLAAGLFTRSRLPLDHRAAA